MNPVNTDNIKGSSSDMKEDFILNNKSKLPDKFDLSIIGKIDLVEAEKIASEEVIFLTEADLIEGLEDFELVPVKNYRDDLKTSFTAKTDISRTIPKKEPESAHSIVEKTVSDGQVKNESTDEINEAYISDVETTKIPEPVVETPALEILEKVSDEEESYTDLADSNIVVQKNFKIEEEPVLKDEIITNEPDEIEINDELSEEPLSTKKLFSVKINEETLDAQLSAILTIGNDQKKDDKILEKYGEVTNYQKCRFIDDQFSSKQMMEEAGSYNEDPLTERLVKMIEVADGKLELLEKTSNEGENLNYILEDYTLYNSEKFDNVFKEEIFYIDSDFEFIDNAIIRDDFTKYIHEIDDYFESEESLIQSEISEILGLIPEENEYIEDKLFGDYYKRYDLDNEIDFIKPEIDFFRSSYTGKKNLNYFSENKISFLDSERLSIEEDISSSDAIVFEEDVSEIEVILKRDYNIDSDKIKILQPVEEEIVSVEEIPDITDRIIILEDKEKLMEFASEFPDKHENLIRLLSYLDGLFEKLPEEVIRKFAESEYFELYSKVLKEMGV